MRIKKAFNLLPLSLKVAALRAGRLLDASIKPLAATEKFTCVAVSDGEIELLIPSKDRVALYRRGIVGRFNYLLQRYTLPGFCEIESDDIVVDVGCHVGEFSMAASSLCERVYAVEGDPIAYGLACVNLSRLPNVEVRQALLADSSRQVTFNLDPASADSSAVNATRSAMRYVTKARTLDDVIGDIPVVDYIKMDAEGFEPEVLAGAPKTLRRIRRLAIDCGPERGGAPTVKEVTSILAPRFEFTVNDHVVFGVARP